MIARLLAILLLLPPCVARAQEMQFPAVPALAVDLLPNSAVEAGAYPHQQLTLRILVASRGPFEELRIDLPDIPGAEVQPLTRPRTRQVRSYAGQGHVHERHIAVFPLQSGPLSIPPVRAVGVVSGADGEIAFDRTSAPLRIEVHPLPPIEHDRWLVARDVAIDEAWSIPLDQIRFGDTVRREITITVLGADAARVPEVEHKQTQRILMAPAGGTARTESSSGGVTAVVSRAWDLTIEGEVVVYFPPVGLHWWDPEERTLKKATVPGHRIEPLVPDRQAVAERLMDEAQASHRGNWAAALAILGGAFALIVGACAPLLRAALPTATDRQLLRQLKGVDTPVSALRVVEGWRRASEIPPERLSDAIRPLETAAYGTGGHRFEIETTAKALCGLSRRRRFEAVFSWYRRHGSRLFGPVRDLPEGPPDHVSEL